MNLVGEAYVKLVLAVGEHDPDYVDAYYGPEEWRAKAKKEKKSLEQIKREAETQITELKALNTSFDEMTHLRHEYLLTQLRSLAARADQLQGLKLSFDEEAKALYDVVPPSYPDDHFARILEQINTALPGEGSLTDRYDKFREKFIIPKEKLDAVLTAAIQEARKRTKHHIQLPEGETFQLEYVTNQAWGAYNWYKGNYRSIIQVNTDLPKYIDGAIGLACHEGYPGHHVYNALLEEQLRRKRGWIEFCIYPLFSPQSLIAEGTANFGVEVAFPDPERLVFERNVLYPLAGLDPDTAANYRRVSKLIEQLNYASNEAARHYLNGEKTREQTIQWLEVYSLLPLQRAEKSVQFIEKYRSYEINYNLGEDLVRTYVESRGGTPDRPEKRWQEFEKLISSPRLPSSLTAD